MFNPFKRGKTEKADKEKAAGSGKETAAVASHRMSAHSSGVLVAPHLTEKTSRLQSMNQYVFEVSDRANAFLVKNAVQKKYGVKVVGVNILNQRGKRVRLGRIIGRSRGFKKAVVTIARGQSIEMS